MDPFPVSMEHFFTQDGHYWAELIHRTVPCLVTSLCSSYLIPLVESAVTNSPQGWDLSCLGQMF